MRRSWAGYSLLPLMAIFLTGCSSIGDKAGNMSLIYGVTTVLSLLLLIAYCCISKKRELWYILLFASVLVVNIGYFTLAVSKNLDEALLANRLAYLGSVFLPLSMWQIILKTTHVRTAKWLPGVLVGVAVVIFFIAASPGYLPIYYKEVSFAQINGVSTLVKVYGPLHVLYLIYLLGYFISMVTTIVYATIKDKLDSLVHATILAIAVFVNIGVWLIEQMVKIDFEVLSVSYIISESFLLGLNLLIAESKKHPIPLPPTATPAKPEDTGALPQEDTREKLELFLAGRNNLTPKEQQLYDCYVSGQTTDVIMAQLNIKENTLKFHSKNLYGKLGVRSRKQLTALHRLASLTEDAEE